MEVLQTLARLSREHRVARLIYKDAGEGRPSERVVEPYALRESTVVQPAFLCWQLSPELDSEPCWRVFRADRIVSVEDAGLSFTPRHNGEQAVARKPVSDSEIKAARYRDYLETALLDGRLTGEEMTDAKQMQEGIPSPTLRGIHAQAFANVLHELLIHGQISDKEQLYIARVRKALEDLGWAP